MDLEEVKYEVVDWIQLAQESGQMRALVNAAKNLRFHKSWGKFLFPQWLSAPEEGRDFSTNPTHLKSFQINAVHFKDLEAGIVQSV
jgi:hypothetical protein